MLGSPKNISKDKNNFITQTYLMNVLRTGYFFSINVRARHRIEVINVINDLLVLHNAKVR